MILTTYICRDVEETIFFSFYVILIKLTRIHYFIRKYVKILFYIREYIHFNYVYCVVLFITLLFLSTELPKYFVKNAC